MPTACWMEETIGKPIDTSNTPVYNRDDKFPGGRCEAAEIGVCLTRNT